jgi:hypothetical protein
VTQRDLFEIACAFTLHGADDPIDLELAPAESDRLIEKMDRLN